MSGFRYAPFSLQQRRLLHWWTADSPVKDKDGIIAHGAIRSGKTLPMSLSYVIWAMTNFNNRNFGCAGKTISSFRRNVLNELKLRLAGRGYGVEERRGDNLFIVTRGQVRNYFYIFGGKDARSQDLVQGVTLAGFFFDEVALMPESFVSQATARCSVAGSKFWFNCNPEHPAHWFKKDWIDKAQKRRLIVLHFVMEDNKSLTYEILERYKRMYSGVFYDRYILGLWTVAEGSIYSGYIEQAQAYKTTAEQAKRDIVYINIGVDFGGNKSYHAFVATGISADFERFYVLKSHRVKATGTSVADVVRAFKAFAEEIERVYGFVDYVYADSAEQVIINSMREATKYSIRNSIKNTITERISATDIMITGKMLFLVDGQCDTLHGALCGAVWSDKADNERLDDGTSDIDTLDAFEYSWERYIRRIVAKDKEGGTD